MSRKIFISYSWKDSIVATRIYSDLVRSHLNVWRDQTDGAPSVDFEDEFNARIDECDDFLILDSINYRHKSNWCLREIERFKENRLNKKGRRIIVCLLDKNGDWRTQFKDEKQKEILSGINRIKNYNFFHEGTYDNNDVYAKSMAMICELYSERFIPWNVAPDIKDLEDEISTSKKTITEGDRNYILREYENIHYLIKTKRDVKVPFCVWIDFCKNCNLDLFFPRYAFCCWMASDVNQFKYDRECYSEFEKLASDFPDDPRCQIGKGAIASRLYMRLEAIQAYEESLRLLDMPKNKWLREHTLLEVVVDMAAVLLNSSKFFDALGYLYRAYDMMQSADVLDIQLIRLLLLCFDELNNLKECERMLLPLVEKFPLEDELYLEVGRLYMKLREYEKSLGYFETAYALSPHVNNAFYILQCQSIINNSCGKEMIAFAESLLARPNVTEDDLFWKGAICHFIFHDDTRAQQFYPNYDYTKTVL